MTPFPTPEEVRFNRERDNLVGIMRHWEARALPMPKNYVVVDLETSGFEINKDLILSIGHVAVEGGKIVSHTDTYLNWPDSGLVDPAWLRDKMEYTRRSMEEKGTNCPMRYHFLQERGVDPKTALRLYLDMFRDFERKGDAFVLHNGINFDIPRLQHHWNLYLDDTMTFGPNSVWDTGAMEKACQLNILPDPADSVYSWSKRVGATRAKGVFFSLDRHCVPKYGLTEKHALDMTHAHGAGHDCFVTHLLFEQYRQFLEATAGPAEPTPPVSVPKEYYGDNY